MGVYLSCEAEQYLAGVALSQSGSEGVLIGHKRGPDYYIEQVFVCSNAFFLSDKEFFQINQHFDLQVMGFYSFASEQSYEQNIMVPFAVGKILLRVKTQGADDLLLDPFLIDYDQTYCLKKMEIHREDKARSK
jgi:hypothetical protein